MTAPNSPKRERNKKRHCSLAYKNRSFPTTTITKSLPKDLWIDIVALVASHSFTDLRNMKKCCKDFLDASEDNYVLQRVSLDKFPLFYWFRNDKATSFLERCKESGNIEMLYRQGILEYFNYPNVNVEGVERLKIAARKGHKEAKYVYGMLLLCSQDNELRKEGLEHMRYLRNSKCVIRCRKNVQRLVGHMWRNPELVRNNNVSLCNCKDKCKGWRLKKGVWSFRHDEDDDLNLCEYCRWDHEIEFFYDLFNYY